MTLTRPWPLPPRDATTIHHITDTHIGSSDPYGGPWVDVKMGAVAADVRSVFVRHVDGMVHTGDIADDGGGSGYQESTQDARSLSWLGQMRQDIPSVWCVGNHDLHSRVTNLGGYGQYSRQAWEHVYGRPAIGTTDIGDVTVMYLAPDTFQEGQEWTLSPATLDWMDTQLSAIPRPVVLASHYTLTELDSALHNLQPAASIDDLIGGHSNVCGYLCGHQHFVPTEPRQLEVVTVGGRSIPHICGPSPTFSGRYAKNPRSETAKSPAYSLYVSIMDPQHWQVRYRTHAPGQWTDVDGWRVAELDSSAGTVTWSQGGS